MSSNPSSDPSPNEDGSAPGPSRVRRAWSQSGVSMFFATCGGVGHIPGAPGTYGAAVALLPVWWASSLPLAVRVGAFVVLTLLSFWWCDRAGRALEEHDSGAIVLDEVVGVWLALLPFADLSLLQLLVGFVAFRFFDISKLPPARWFDRSMSNGVGVVMDDVVAGVWALLVVALVF